MSSKKDRSGLSRQKVTEALDLDDTFDPYHSTMLSPIAGEADDEEEWLDEDLEEGMSPLDFDYYYTLTDANPQQGSFTWTEMSYRREHTGWDAFEKTELELFEEEMVK